MQGQEGSPWLAQETASGNLENWKFGHFLQEEQSWRNGVREVQRRSQNNEKPEEYRSMRQIIAGDQAAPGNKAPNQSQTPCLGSTATFCIFSPQAGGFLLNDAFLWRSGTKNGCFLQHALGRSLLVQTPTLELQLNQRNLSREISAPGAVPPLEALGNSTGRTWVLQ